MLATFVVNKKSLRKIKQRRLESLILQSKTTTSSRVDFSEVNQMLNKALRHS